MSQGAWRSSRTTGRRARWAIGLTCAAAAMTVVPGVAGAADPLQEVLGAPKPAPSSGQPAPSLSRLQHEAAVQAIAQATARRAHVASAGARAERRHSRGAFGALGASGALRLTAQQFGDDLAAVATTPADSLADDRVLGFKDDFTARVDPAGPRKHELAISTGQPFRVRDDAGRKALVDLDLESKGTGFAPANPIVGASLPAASDGEMTVGPVSLTASIPGGGTSDARRIGDSGVFYPDAGTDTDLVATPTVAGLETFFTLRSPEAPETASLSFDLPAGAGLGAPDDSGAVAIVRGGKRIGRIAPPTAVDAQGTPVAVAATVSGDTLTVHTAHRGKDVAYPILVDPEVEIDSLDPAPSVSNTFDPDDVLATLPYGEWAISEDTPSGFAADTGTKGDGLYLHDESSGSIVVNAWIWTPPVAIAQIYEAELGPYDLELHGDTSPGVVAAGLFTPEGSISDAVNIETSGGSFDLDIDEADPEETADINGVEFILARLSSNPPDHDAFLGGAVMHVEDLEVHPPVDGDGPTFDFEEPLPDPFPTIWTNATGLQPFSVSATSTTSGVQRIELTVKRGSGPELLMGYTADDCGPTPLDPCDATMDDEFNVNWSILDDEGQYTVRIRAYDGEGHATTIALPVGVDRTAPVTTLSGDVADLDGLTTDSTATLTLGIDSEVGDGITNSGIASLSVSDSMSEYYRYLDCTVDDCDDLDADIDFSTLSEGEHTLTVHAYDYAGNDTEDHVTFTIDRP